MGVAERTLRSIFVDVCLSLAFLFIVLVLLFDHLVFNIDAWVRGLRFEVVV